MTHPSSKSDCRAESPVEFLQRESIQGKYPKKMVVIIVENVFISFCVQTMAIINP